MGYKLSKIYVGTQQVRPSRNHYEVDFSTYSSLPSDWTATSGGTVVQGSGLSGAGDTGVYKAIDLSTANTFSCVITGTKTTTSWAGWDIIGVTDLTNTSNPDWYYNTYGMHGNYQSNYSYNSTGSYLFSNIGGSETVLNKITGKTPVGGDYTLTLNIDFTTGAMEGIQYDSGSGYTNNPTYTLNSSQISTIKSYGYIMLFIFAPNGISNYCKTVTIDIT